VVGECATNGIHVENAVPTSLEEGNLSVSRRLAKPSLRKSELSGEFIERHDQFVSLHPTIINPRLAAATAAPKR